MKRRYQIISAELGLGAQLRACEKGPAALRNFFLEHSLHSEPSSITWEILLPTIKTAENKLSFADSLPIINAFNHHLALKVQTSLEQGLFPIVLGGDHSIALGTWSGVVNYKQPLGLIWMDAHMDAHTPKTTPSGAWHGMPLASLLGHDDLEVFSSTNLQPKGPIILPQNLCLIGVRSFEKEEKELLQRLNVRVYYMDEIQSRGLKIVLDEAIQRVSKETQAYGISLDLDVVDPKEAPGVGSPAAGGISSHELISAFSLIQNDSRLKAFELVELNPELDVAEKTLRLCVQILKSL